MSLWTPPKVFSWDYLRQAHSQNLVEACWEEAWEVAFRWHFPLSGLPPSPEEQLSRKQTASEVKRGCHAPQRQVSPINLEFPTVTAVRAAFFSGRLVPKLAAALRPQRGKAVGSDQKQVDEISSSTSTHPLCLPGTWVSVPVPNTPFTTLQDSSPSLGLDTSPLLVRHFHSLLSPTFRSSSVPRQCLWILCPQHPPDRSWSCKRQRL